MLEFLQTNAGWILLGVFFLFMVRMHGGGSAMGHDHGHGMGEQPLAINEPRGDSKGDAGAESQAKPKPPASHAGGCH